MTDNIYTITHLDKEYSSIMETILKNGFTYEDPNRKGVVRKQIPYATISADNNDGVISVRKSYFKGAVAELLMFLKGETRIEEFRNNGIKFWDKDVENRNKRLGLKENDDTYNTLGKSYPYQYKKQYHIFDNFKSNPYRTDLIVNSWNIDDLKDMCLIPCHHIYQFVKTEKGFGIVFNMRSSDVLLGLPMNIGFYWLMGKILEIWSGHQFDFVRGELHNVHLYDNQFDLAQKVVNVANQSEVIKAEHYIEIDTSEWNTDLPFDEFIKNVEPKHFKLKNYKSIINETVEMLAYSE